MRKVGLICVLSAQTLLAAPNTWNGSVDSNWSTPGNWSLGTPVNGQALLFPTGPTNTTANNDLNLSSILSIEINNNAANYLITGNPLIFVDPASFISQDIGAHIITNDLVVGQSLAINGNMASGDLTLNGVISGNQVSFNGVAVSLTAVSTYTGGTNLSGNTGVTVTASAELPTTGVVFINNGVIFLQNGPQTFGNLAGTNVGSTTVVIDTSLTVGDSTDQIYNGHFTGGLPNTYSLIKQGSGKLTLDGDMNNYMGSAHLKEGTIAIGQVFSLSSQPLTMEDSTTLQAVASFTPSNALILGGRCTVDTQANILIVNMPITDSTSPGTLVKIGIGQLLLSTATNTYSGGTTVNEGIFTVQTSTSFPSNSAPLILNGGTSLNLEYMGTIQQIGSLSDGISGGGNVYLGAGGAETLDTGSDGTTTTFSGVIANGLGSVGSLIKNGGGRFTLNGDSTYTGTTTINAGTLEVNGSLASPMTTVNSPAILAGIGTLGSVTNHGTVSPGNSIGTMTMASYSQPDGVYLDEINAIGQTDLIRVTGAAALGGSLVVVPDPGIYVVGTPYTILTSGGARTGQFAPPNFGPLNMGIQYLSNSVVLTVLEQALIFRGIPRHHNPTQVFNYLNTLTYSFSSDLTNVVNLLANLPDPTDALDQLHPATFGAFDLINANTSSMITTIFTERVEEDCRQRPCDNFCLWVEPFGYTMLQDRIGEQVGFRTWDGGVLAGIDYLFCNRVLLGFGGGYSYEHVHWKEDRGYGDVNSGYLGFYSNWTGKMFYGDAAVVFGVNSYEASRKIQFSSLQRKAKHSNSGYDITAHIGGGVDFAKHFFHFEPYAEFDYLYLHQAGFTEHGADSLNLHVKARNSNMLRSELGLYFTKNFKIRTWCLAPAIWVSGVNECYLQTQHFRASLVNEGGEFAVRTFNKSITLFSPGASLSYLSSHDTSFTLSYSAELNSTTITQKADARIECYF